MRSIGVAGCGRMGAPMLAALLGSGFNAKGLDIRPVEEFGNLSPFVTNDIDSFAAGLDTLFTVVRDIPQTDAVLFGASGVLVRSDALETIVICSTLSPRYVQQLRSRVPERISLVDAPMSGAAVAAEKGQLSFMLGGEESDLNQIQPCLDAMGLHFQKMGGFGSGMQAKVLNNLLAASHTMMTRLVLDWAKELDLDEQKLLALIHTSSGQNWFASGMDEIEFASDGYSDDNSIGILKKDVESALDAAPDGLDTRLPELLRDMIVDLKPRTGA